MTTDGTPGPVGFGGPERTNGASRRPEIRLTADWVSRAMGGVARPAERDPEFSGVSIDTRTLAPGELFVALRGSRFDGADFVDAAVAAGAAGVVVERGRFREPAVETKRQGGPSPVVIEVADAIGALQALARSIRRESGARVVAITGSAGKTTTKEVTAEFLATRYRVMRNRGNLNNHIGLPLSLIDLRRRPDAAVVELGMNHAGEISTLVHIAEPEVRVWTNVGEAHLGFFASVEEIADAKSEILEGATASTVLVANADDDRIGRRISRFAGRVVTFGIASDADVRATSIRSRGIDGTEAIVKTPAGSFELTTPLIGSGNLANILAAAAVAVEFDVPLPAIGERAARLTPPAHRGEILRLADGIVVIDDSYNANPTAVARALDVLAEATAARRLAVLGEMLELGDRSVALHEDVGRAAARLKLDSLVAVGGPSARGLSEAAIAAGMSRGGVRYFATSEEAADAVARIVEPGDLVLIKGSRGIRTERVVERLKTELG